MASQSHREAAIGFLTLVAEGRVDEAYERHVGPGFRHHNPYFRGDAAALQMAMQQNATANPGKILEVKLSLEDDDQVAVLSHIRQDAGDRGAAVVHLFRFENGRIVEMWDVGMDVPDAAVNENGVF